MKIYGGDNWNKGSWMKIHDGESEMPIDVWSMVVKIWNKGSWMKIHDGESEMPIDVWSMVVKIWNKGDALDKLMVGGCPK